METKVKMVCAHCGSDEVRADAYAQWDVEAQEWEVAQTFDKGAYCSKCDGETRIEELPLAVSTAAEANRAHRGAAENKK
jgi:hypothetical protein